MIKADLMNEILVSGTGRKYRFSRNLYLDVVKFIMKKFDIPFSSAQGQVDYFIVQDRILKNGKYIHRCDSTKKATNARLHNIIELDYSWEELWGARGY